jgi:hypothetical protein
VRARSTASLAGLAAAAALVLAGCGGGEKTKDDAPAAAPTTRLAPVPKVSPSQVKALVGTWVGPAKDSFVFKADGSGTWSRGGRTLWSGQVIPEGGGKFRFSWQGGDPQSGSYWGIRLTEGGSKLVFAGTNQTYEKAKSTKAQSTKAKK